MIYRARITRGRLWKARLESLRRAGIGTAALLTGGAIVALLTVAPPAIANGVCGGALEAKHTLERIIAADNTRDLEAALSHYTTDVVWSPPAGREVIGRGAIRDSYLQMYAAYEPALSIAIVEAVADGHLAMVRGTTRGELKGKNGNVVVHDRFIAQLRCDHGDWYVARMMWGPEPAE